MAWRKKQSTESTRNPREQAHQRAQVFSYYSSRTPHNETGNRPSERGRPAIPEVRLASVAWWIKYMPSLISLGIMFFAASYITTLSTRPKFDVRTGNKEATVLLRETQEYQSAGQKLLEQHVLNRSKLTFDSDALAHELENQFPELGDVIVTVPLFGRKPIIEAQPAKPALLLAAQNGVYVIDTNGTAVLKASDLISEVRDELPVIEDSTDTQIKLGKQALPIDTVSFIAQLGYQFTQKNIRTDAYTLPAIANEVHVKPSGQPYYIKFNTEIDPRQQAGTYFALMNRLTGEGKKVTEYIDVRVEERVFYK